MAIKINFMVEYYGSKGTLTESITSKQASVEKLWESVSTRLLLFPEKFSRAVIKVYDDTIKEWVVITSLSNEYTTKV